MTLSIKNGGYAFLIRLDLMFSMSLWKEFQLLQILNDLSIRHLIKLILYENDDNEKDSLILLNFLNNRNHNIEFTTEKQINDFIAFLDGLISGVNNQNLTLHAYDKSTYTELLLNFKSFTSFSYKISLIKCLIDRLLKICNNWTCFLMT